MATKSAQANFKRILLPTDFTEASGHAAAYALSMAVKYKARLFVMHVVDTTGEAAGFYVPHASFTRLDKELVDVAEMMLKKFCAKQFKSFKSFDTKVTAGEPYKEIIKSVKKNNIDVVVMGTFGRGGLDKFFFGSTTDRVLRKTDRPVLVIPPPEVNLSLNSTGVKEMFGIGFAELVLVLVVALLVVGPDKLPGLAKSVAKAYNELRRTGNDIKRSVTEVDIGSRLGLDDEQDRRGAASDEAPAKQSKAAKPRKRAKTAKGAAPGKGGADGLG